MKRLKQATLKAMCVLMVVAVVVGISPIVVAAHEWEAYVEIVPFERLPEKDETD